VCFVSETAQIELRSERVSVSPCRAAPVAIAGAAIDLVPPEPRGGAIVLVPPEPCRRPRSRRCLGAYTRPRFSST